MTAVGEEDGVAESGPAPVRQMSLLTFILIVVALTLAAAGIGYVGGLQILASAEKATSSSRSGEGGELGDNHGNGANLKVLPPVVTNLAGRPPVWIRLEASLLFRNEIPGDADELMARITEDIVSFLRTTSVEQIQGATGFQHLSEDLNDRVRVRSNGSVREIIIQGLIVE